MNTTPVETVIEICGGHAKVAAMCGIHPSWVYRWTYPRGKRGGTGGLIPAKHQARLLDEARRLNIPLRPEHFFSRGDDAAALICASSEEAAA
jgi:hypothetical protein